MTRYLMSVCYPTDGVPPSPEELEQITADLTLVHQELEAAGAWVFGGGLHHPSTAKVLHARNGEVVSTDGPFIESKEMIGGFSIIEVPDEATALRWAEKLSLATTCAIEVRPFMDDPGA